VPRSDPNTSSGTCSSVYACLCVSKTGCNIPYPGSLYLSRPLLASSQRPHGRPLTPLSREWSRSASQTGFACSVRVEQVCTHDFFKCAVAPALVGLPLDLRRSRASMYLCVCASVCKYTYTYVCLYTSVCVLMQVRAQVHINRFIYEYETCASTLGGSFNMPGSMLAIAPFHLLTTSSTNTSISHILLHDTYRCKCKPQLLSLYITKHS